MSDFTFDFDSFSDLYKDTYNVRPRGHRFYHPETTDAERQEIWDDLLVEHGRAMDEYQHEIDAADAAFEAQIATNLQYGAADTATAIRWIVESYQLDEYDMREGFRAFQYHANISEKYQVDISLAMENLLTVE